MSLYEPDPLPRVPEAEPLDLPFAEAYNLDLVPPDGGWMLRRILEHVRNSERDYLEAVRRARSSVNEAIMGE